MSKWHASRPDATLTSTLIIIVVMVTVTSTASYYAINYPPTTSASSTATALSSSVSSSPSTTQSLATVTANDGGFSYNVVYDSAKGELFVTHYAASTVSVVSDSTDAVVVKRQCRQ